MWANSTPFKINQSICLGLTKTCNQLCQLASIFRFFNILHQANAVEKPKYCNRPFFHLAFQPNCPSNIHGYEKRIKGSCLNLMLAQLCYITVYRESLSVTILHSCNNQFLSVLLLINPWNIRHYSPMESNSLTSIVNSSK